MLLQLPLICLCCDPPLFSLVVDIIIIIVATFNSPKQKLVRVDFKVNPFLYSPFVLFFILLLSLFVAADDVLIPKTYGHPLTPPTHATNQNQLL